MYGKPPFIDLIKLSPPTHPFRWRMGSFLHVSEGVMVWRKALQHRHFGRHEKDFQVSLLVTAVLKKTVHPIVSEICDLTSIFPASSL